MSATVKYDWNTLFTEQFAPPVYLDTYGFIRSGSINWFVGASGIGKSWVACQLILDLLSRGKRVLYLDAENLPVDTRNRLAALMWGAALSPDQKLTEDQSTLTWEQIQKAYSISDNFLLRNGGLALNTAEGRAELQEMVEGFNPDVVFVDPLANFLTGTDSSDADVKAMLSPLLDLKQQRNVAIVIIHHPPKDKPNSYKGTGNILGSADGQLQATRCDENSLYLDFNKVRHDAEPDYRYRITRRKVSHTLIDTEHNETVQINGLALDFEKIMKPVSAGEAKVKILTPEEKEAKQIASALEKVTAFFATQKGFTWSKTRLFEGTGCNTNRGEALLTYLLKKDIIEAAPDGKGYKEKI